MNAHIFNIKRGFIKILLIIIGVFTSNLVMAQNVEDSLKIHQAIKDYVYAIYDADTGKVYKSVHPELAKRGFYYSDGKPMVSSMSFTRLIEVAKTWRKPNIKVLEPEITIFDILDLTASAKVKAHWGIDYFHLSKISGEWKIYNVMWQKHPQNN